METKGSENATGLGSCAWEASMITSARALKKSWSLQKYSTWQHICWAHFDAVLTRRTETICKTGVYCVGWLSSFSFHTTNEQNHLPKVEEKKVLQEECTAQYKYLIIGLEVHRASTKRPRRDSADEANVLGTQWSTEYAPCSRPWNLRNSHGIYKYFQKYFHLTKTPFCKKKKKASSRALNTS